MWRLATIAQSWHAGVLFYDVYIYRVGVLSTFKRANIDIYDPGTCIDNECIEYQALLILSSGYPESSNRTSVSACVLTDVDMQLSVRGYLGACADSV